MRSTPAGRSRWMRPGPGMARVTVGEREQMWGWDRRQAVMAVANMVESLLRGSGQTGGEPDGEDRQLASVEAGDRVCAAVDGGADAVQHRVDPAAVRPGRYRRG